MHLFINNFTRLQKLFLQPNLYELNGGALLSTNKYYEIYLKLKQKITQEDFVAGELLPSENTLAKQYAVSRETIRKSLEYLSQDGLIQKQQGRGSIVLNSSLVRFPISGLTSFKELADVQMMSAKTKVIRNEIIEVDENLQQKLKIPAGRNVLAIERIRKINEQNSIYDYDYLNLDIVGEIPDERLQYSLYDYLENDLKLPIAFANKEIVVENVSDRDREYLDLRDEDNHLVVVRSHVYLEDACYFQFSESRHRVDKFRFVDFSRRQHSLDEHDF